MFPQGFFGTRADLLFDLVTCSLVLVVPLLLYSWKMARQGKYQAHRLVQLGLTVVLAAVLVVFEMNLRAKGGIFEITRASRFAGTPLLNISIYTHMIFAFSSATLWSLLVITALMRFPTPPQGNALLFSHRFWGRLAMLDVVLTGVSAVELYLVGFVF